jgi:hypothetical protein
MAGRIKEIIVKDIDIYMLVAAVSVVFACSNIPPSVREYATSLPARADGQYAVLDAPIKKQLILMDALLPCAIDVADKKKADESPACRCSKASSSDWTADCKAWLGSHVPVDSRPAPAPAPDTGPAAGSAAESAAGSNMDAGSNQGGNTNVPH